MKITVVVDHESWIIPYAQKLCQTLGMHHQVEFVRRYEEISPSDTTFFLGCIHIAPPEILRRSRHNLVVHESALPKGRGWSPLTWQVLEGKNEIPFCLFEATPEADGGSIYFTDVIQLEGHELVDELRARQGDATISLALRFVEAYPHVQGRPQVGEATHYPRRRPMDSRLDPNRPLIEQFNLLRVCDNERYPAYFEHMGHTYILKVYKVE